MPLTTLVARHNIVTVSLFFSYSTLPLTHSPDRRLDLPRWSSDFHGDQRSLHFRSCPFPCLPSPCQGRGCRSRGRHSACHLLRAQCWCFSASISPFIHIPLASMIARPDCVSISCGTSATCPCYRWPSWFTPNQSQPVVTLIDNTSSLPDAPILQTLVRQLIDGLCHRPVHLVTHHRHGTPRPTTFTWT